RFSRDWSSDVCSSDLLSSIASRSRTPTGRRFPALGNQSRSAPVLCDGGRFRSPLRGSPGFPPGSLLSRPQCVVANQQQRATISLDRKSVVEGKSGGQG